MMRTESKKKHTTTSRRIRASQFDKVQESTYRSPVAAAASAEHDSSDCSHCSAVCPKKQLLYVRNLHLRHFTYSYIVCTCIYMHVYV
jgi:hypothetical protein